MKCPCGSAQEFSECCQVYLDHRAQPASPEALMRSRYTAYTLANIDYIAETMSGLAALNFQKESSEQWAKSVTWLGLVVLAKENNSVTFAARYQQQEKIHFIYEKSYFENINNRWYYIAGEQLKLGRNQQCLCGSGQKYKKCCA